MKKTAFCLMLVLILFSTQVSAQQDNTVIVTGFGKTEAEAKYNAFTTAIEQVLGVMISAETQIEDGELIKDKIRANVEGHIESYTVISTGKDDDVYIVTVKATVAKKILQEYIAEASHLNDEQLSYDESSCRYTMSDAVLCTGGDIALFNMNYGIYADSFATLRFYTGEDLTEAQLYIHITVRDEYGFRTGSTPDGNTYDLRYVYLGNESSRNPDRTYTYRYIAVLGDSIEGFRKYAEAGLELTMKGTKNVTVKVPAAYIRGFVKYMEEVIEENDL